MGCINQVNISGNLTRSPEIKATKGGYLARFSVAQNRRVGNEDKPQFFDCVKFMGKEPSAAMQRFWESLEKGRRVFVSGQLRQDRWEKDGERRATVYIAVDELDTVGKPSADPSSYASGQQMPMAAATPQVPTPDIYPEDIPF